MNTAKCTPCPVIGTELATSIPMSQEEWENELQKLTDPATPAFDSTLAKTPGYKIHSPIGYDYWMDIDEYKDYYKAIDQLTTLEATVFPANQPTIRVQADNNYGTGAHRYVFDNCVGFKDGQTAYIGTLQCIQFVQKNDDGTIIPGLQSEQIVLALIDRQTKLNARFPSAHSDKMLAGLNMFIEACKERVQERMARGVMGNLAK